MHITNKAKPQLKDKPQRTDKPQSARLCGAQPQAAARDLLAPGPKLLTGNIDYPGGRTVIELLRTHQSRERLQLQRISLTLLCASVIAVTLALTLYFAERYPAVAAVVGSNQAAQTLLLATLALSVIAYFRRTYLKAFAAVLCIAVTSLYLHETLLLHSVAERMGYRLHHDGVRLSCVLSIAVIGYFARCYLRSRNNIRFAIFTIPSTRLFLVHLLPLFTLVILLTNSLIEYFLPAIHDNLVEQIFLRYAYAALFIALLIDVFTVDHSNLHFNPSQPS